MRKITLIVSFFALASIYAQDVNLEVFANGFTSPLAIEHAGDSRLFVVERAGVIKILNSD